MGMFKQYAEQLVKEGKAYYCFCTEERLNEMHEAQRAAGEMTHYDGHCRHLTQEEIDAMASTYTEGYRIGFVRAGKDLAIKKTVNIRYTLGFERIVKQAIANFRAMGLEPIPKMNFSACHDEWLGDYGRMLSTSDYYRVCEDLIRDCCEIFDHPRYFHFGYDEEDIRCQSAFELTVVRQGELWWHDFLWFVKTIEKCGMRPWMWSDYAWEHHDEFLKRCPRSVLQSNWYYDEGFNERAFRWPRVKCYLDLDKAGFDQIPTGSNHLYDTNMAETVAFSEKNLSPVRLKGYMMSTWRRCLAEHRQRNLAAADQIGAARTKFER